MKYARIISDEPRFYRMLSLELAELNVIVVVDFNSTNSDDELYVIADIDNCSVDELKEVSPNTTLIGYSGDLEDVADKAALCGATLHRPFRMSELMSYIDNRVVARRPSTFGKAIEKSVLPLSLTIDAVSHSARFGDLMIPLSDNEFKVLEALVDKRGEAVTRETIDSLLGVTDGNMGDVYICHLRRKIDNKLGLKLIYTVRGKGYMLKN